MVQFFSGTQGQEITDEIIQQYTDKIINTTYKKYVTDPKQAQEILLRTAIKLHSYSDNNPNTKLAKSIIEKIKEKINNNDKVYETLSDIKNLYNKKLYIKYAFNTLIPQYRISTFNERLRLFLPLMIKYIRLQNTGAHNRKAIIENIQREIENVQSEDEIKILEKLDPNHPLFEKDKYICPLTFSIMRDPCYTLTSKSHRHYFERSAIEKHIEISQARYPYTVLHPITRSPLLKEDLINDSKLQEEIKVSFNNAIDNLKKINN